MYDGNIGISIIGWEAFSESIVGIEWQMYMGKAARIYGEWVEHIISWLTRVIVFLK